VAVAVAAVAGFAPVRAQEPSAKAAQASVEAWLSIVDRQNYPDSWDAAAALFKNAISREQWTAALEKVRTPLGQVKSRVLKTAVPTKSPPGAPDGEYVIIQFDTSYEQRPTAAELVTVFQESDGIWRVVGYFIK
jgi:hypothetical protein